ncbi:MAG: PIN domain nuclease [Sphingobacteriaceae bacterium]|nr:PIN domain nuclease [Cytophagaceae bacterium]
MNDLLFDTSVWIDYFRGILNPKTDLLETALFSDWTVWICPVIIQEVLQGVRSEHEWMEVKDKFSYLERLESDPYPLAEEAAALFRTLRQQGTTIRKSNDCLIARYAIEADLRVVHNDVDFDRIANGSALKVYEK